MTARLPRRRTGRGCSGPIRLVLEAAPLEAVLDAVSGLDAFVVDDQAPTLTPFAFGEMDERVAEESVVLVGGRHRDGVGETEGRPGSGAARRGRPLL